MVRDFREVEVREKEFVEKVRQKVRESEGRQTVRR